LPGIAKGTGSYFIALMPWVTGTWY